MAGQNANIILCVSIMCYHNSNLPLMMI